MAVHFIHLWDTPDISEGSAGMHLRCGGKFNYYFAKNFLLSLLVKEFWKSVSIWQSKMAC